MFRYLFRKPLAKTYRVLYTAGTGHFFLSVEVVKVAEEFIEAMVRRQVLVTISEVVLAELSRCVAVFFQQTGDRRVFFL